MVVNQNGFTLRYNFICRVGAVIIFPVAWATLYFFFVVVAAVDTEFDVRFHFEDAKMLKFING